MIARTDTDEAAASKAVLFCPRCRYRAPWDEWCPGEDAHRLRCPNCGETIG